MAAMNMNGNGGKMAFRKTIIYEIITGIQYSSTLRLKNFHGVTAIFMELLSLEYVPFYGVCNCFTVIYNIHTRYIKTRESSVEI